MPKTIAVDIDDVLSATAEGFIDFSNRHFGTKLTMDDYQDDWSAIWKVDLAEVARRGQLYYDLEKRLGYAEKVGALQSLQLPRTHYKLIVITSRGVVLEQTTIAWLDQHFPDVFSEVHFSGIYDGKLRMEMTRQNKNELLRSKGADYLVDDQLKHCIGAAEVGMTAVLFGDYAWNRSENLPPGITRCKNWRVVEDYFNGRD